MPELSLKEIAHITGGEAHPGTHGGDPRFSDYAFDSRQMKENGLFFALRTECGDGHRYVSSLNHLAGSGAVVARAFSQPNVRIPLVRVDDPLTAAEKLAMHVRQTFRRVRYLGVTGSAGKTTTKEFIYQILASRWQAYRSPQNWNNHLGLPFALLKMDAKSEVAVFELAMSDPGIGEIDRLAAILRPDVAMVLNVYPVHLEFLHTLENIARAKLEICSHLEADDMALLNGDCEMLRMGAPKTGRVIFFGTNKEHNSMVLQDIVRRGEESDLVSVFYGIRRLFTSRLTNRLHLENLHAAIVACHCLGMKHIEIQEAIQGLQPVAGRGIQRRINGWSVIDETYNSNPEALKKMLSWVNEEFSGNDKVAVLGDMLELGEGEARFHHDVGHYFARLAFRFLVTVAERGAWIAEGAIQAGFPCERIRQFADAVEAGKWMRKNVAAGSVILFKASRGVLLEKAIEEMEHE